MGPGNNGKPSRPWLPQVWWGLLWVLAIQVWFLPPAGAAAADAILLEDLHYRVDVLLLSDAVRVRLTLTGMGPGRYLAELSGEAQGALALLLGQHRDTFQTEMVLQDGRLLPVVYREECRYRGKTRLKEYRFDYDQNRVELWQLKEGKGLVRKWDTVLQGPMHDPLSAFYNCRLGMMGPLREGETIKITGIPYPKPEEMEVRIGPETRQGRKAMVTIRNAVFADERGVILAYLDGKMVPQQAWTHILGFGKITGVLLPGSAVLKHNLTASSWAPETRVSGGAR